MSQRDLLIGASNEVMDWVGKSTYKGGIETRVKSKSGRKYFVCSVSKSKLYEGWPFGDAESAFVVFSVHPGKLHSAFYDRAAAIREAVRLSQEPILTPVGSLAFGDGRSGAELLAAGRYDWVGELARKFAESSDFPIEADHGMADLELVEFDFDLTSPELLAEFVRLELERPTAEDALRFGEKYPDKQRERPIAFIHEPWEDPFKGRDVLVLRGDRRKRGLALYWYDDRWYRGVLFAARRRKQPHCLNRTAAALESKKESLGEFQVGLWVQYTSYGVGASISYYYGKITRIDPDKKIIVWLLDIDTSGGPEEIKIKYPPPRSDEPSSWKFKVVSEKDVPECWEKSKE